MGMGEPFMNYESVMEAIKILNDKNCFGVGARHISISSCGVFEGIRKLSQSTLQLNLAISLHAPNEKLRSELMPINEKYPLSKLMLEIEKYIKKKNRRVMFEYMLIDGVNDTEKHAGELADLINNKLYLVNLIRYNPTGKFKPSKSLQITKFKDILKKSGVAFTQRFSFGGDIEAACGQLGEKIIKG
jgi:23S rRNA (adenine2503-C2)-methyltransferase